MRLTYIEMKRRLLLPLILALTLASCGDRSSATTEEIIASGNLEAIRSKKAEMVTMQNEIKDQIALLDKALEKLDTDRKVPLVTTFTVEEQLFDHYLELQGNVTTKDLLVLYPQYSGVLTEVYVKEGSRVQKGQLLARIDDGGLSQQLAQLKIQFELARTTFERQQRLWEQKIGSEIQYLQAKSNYEAQEQAIGQMEQQLAKTVVTAPFSGTIDDVMTEKGSVVMAGQSSLMRIVNLQNMYIETEVPEKYISSVTVNKNVEIEFPVLQKKLTSRIRQVGDFINPNNRTFKAEVSIPNNGNTVKPNLTARLRINDYTNEKALLIPQSIISENATGEQYIYVVEERNGQNEAVAKKVIIETGLTQGDVIEVTSGLEHGQEIIREGARSVNEGQQVRILNSNS